METPLEHVHQLKNFQGVELQNDMAIYLPKYPRLASWLLQ